MTNQDGPNTAGAAEPVAWMYINAGNLVRLYHEKRGGLTSIGYTETPLYILSAENAALTEKVERLEGAITAIDRIVERNIKEDDGPYRARWKGEVIEGVAAEMVYSVLRAAQRLCRAAVKPEEG